MLTLGLTQKQLHILNADAYCLAALRKPEICLIFFKFLRLVSRAPQLPKFQTYFFVNP